MKKLFHVAVVIGVGSALGLGSSAWAAGREVTSDGGTRVLLQTSFEQGQSRDVYKAPKFQLAKGFAHTGEYSLVAEVIQPNQAQTLEVPFQVKQGKVIRVSCWIRSDRYSSCSTFVRVGKIRTMIGAKIDKVDAKEWQRVLAIYRAGADATGVIQINLPSSWHGRTGKAWIDDLTVVEADDDCQYPEHVMDFPAIACDGKGPAWMAALERPAGRKLIGIYRVDHRQREQVCTLEPEKLTGIAAPAVAALDKGCLVVFPAERNGVWQIAYAFVDKRTLSGSASSCKFIESKGTANISPAVAVLGSKVCILWESNAGNARGIYACWVDRESASPVQRISSADANSYNPAVVTLENDSLFAAWDSACNKGIDIYGAWFRDGKWEAQRRITSDERIERHPSLAVWHDQVWMAWQAQSYNKRNLNLVREQRAIVARIDEKGLSAPKDFFDRVSTGDKFYLRPRIAFDASGRLWLTARESLGQQAGWLPMAWCYSGDQWSEPRAIVDEAGRWRPVNMTRTPDGLIAACEFDNIPAGRCHAGIQPDLLSGIAIPAVLEQNVPATRSLEVEPLKMPPTEFSLAQKIALCSADLPRQTLRHGGKELHLYWGNLHEHSDLSVCGRSINPPGHDLFANDRDIERLDFCALTDHDFDYDRPMWAYNGEQARNNNDPGRFVTFLGLEWTSSANPPAVPGQPNRYGHHNLIFLDQYHGHVYDSYDGDITPADLWKQMKGVEFICIPHELADWQGKGKGNPPTDWNYVDEKLQPLAEIFQLRQSYEYFGCPRQSPQGAPFKGYYLQDAWAKGIVIGTIASSDHGGGMGKAGVWAEQLTRESLFEAMRARHTFGTSGAKMGLFFTADNAVMGDKVKHLGKPITFQMRAVAMSDIKELVIFRNNQIVYQSQPNAKELESTWTDPNPPSGETLWYYARIHAVDDELAWSSPIWFVP